MVTHPITSTACTLVEDARRQADVTPFALARKAGIPRSTLIRKLDGHDDFRLSELARIADALGADYSKWLRELAKAAA